MPIVGASFQEVLSVAEQAISIPSLSGDEGNVLRFFESCFQSFGWSVERIPISDERYNLLVTFGVPEIIFTTHVDVVPGPDFLFRPRRADDAIFGRGSCDAKGIAATMVGVCRYLEKTKRTNFGLLLVVGEEDDGIGAITAARELKGRGIRHLINGEPTKNRLVVGHKGFVRFQLKATGRAAHSGYPELGDDANAKLVRTLARVLEADFGSDPILGKGTLTIGTLKGGVASNVVSPAAECDCSVRLVGPKDEVLESVRRAVRGEAELTEMRSVAAVRLKSIPGFETETVAYVTDVPAFLPLTENCYLYGPGSIDVAHSNDEHLKLIDVEAGLRGYLKIFEILSASA